MPTRLWFLLLVVVVLIAAPALFFGVLILGGEGGRRRLYRFARPLYKHVFNPYSLRNAARGDSTWATQM